MKRLIAAVLLLAQSTAFAAPTGLDYFTREQAPDGSWTALAEPSSVLYNTFTVFLYEYLGQLEQKRERVDGLMRYLWSRQSEDGGFAGFPGGASDHAISVLSYVAARIAGESEDSARMRRLADFIRGFRGDKREFLYLPYLWLFGINSDAACLGAATEPLLLSAEGELPWIRAVLYPMVHLYVSGGIHRLSPAQLPSRLTELAGRCPSRFPHPFQKLFARHKRFWKWMESHVNEDGTFFDYAPTTIPALMAFSSGGTRYASLIEKGVARIEEFQISKPEGILQSPGESSVGETNHVLGMFLDLGLGPEDPRVARAESFLWSVQQPATGAFGFSKHNLHFPDSDDTSSALFDLKRIALQRGSSDPEKERRMEKGLDWLLTLQNPDGGFATWDRERGTNWLWSRAGKRSGIVLTESIAEHTGRIAQTLELFASERPRYARAYEHALQFLVKKQLPDGSYAGTWMNDYLLGTSMALSGLASGIGTHPESRELRAAAEKAVRYLLAQQREDGSFSESPLSFTAGRTIPLSEGSPAQTGLVVARLMYYRERTFTQGLDDAIAKAVSYLKSTRQNDGTWKDDAWVGVIFPKIEYVRYPYIQQVGATECVELFERSEPK